MKRMFALLIAMLAISSFVVAAGSEITTDFIVDSPKKVISPYVPSSNTGDYLGYFVLVIVVLAVVYFITKNKKSLVKRQVSRKSVSKRKASKRRVSKKKSVRKKK